MKPQPVDEELLKALKRIDNNPPKNLKFKKKIESYVSFKNGYYILSERGKIMLNNLSEKKEDQTRYYAFEDRKARYIDESGLRKTDKLYRRYETSYLRIKSDSRINQNNSELMNRNRWGVVSNWKIGASVYYCDRFCKNASFNDLIRIGKLNKSSNGFYVEQFWLFNYETSESLQVVQQEIKLHLPNADISEHIISYSDRYKKLNNFLITIYSETDAALAKLVLDLKKSKYSNIFY